VQLNVFNINKSEVVRAEILQSLRSFRMTKENANDIKIAKLLRQKLFALLRVTGKAKAEILQSLCSFRMTKENANDIKIARLLRQGFSTSFRTMGGKAE